MKKTILFVLMLVTASVTFWACDNNEALRELSKNYSGLRERGKGETPFTIDELFTKLQKDVQVFKVESRDGQVDAKFECKEGTVIVVKSLKTADGKPFDGVALVKIQEFFTTGDMVIAGLQTESNGQMLISGGSLNIDAEDANTGDKLIVTLDAILPDRTNDKGAEKEMELFVGEEPNRKVPAFNWQPAINEWEAPAPTPFGGYTMANLSNGYVNCDALFNYLPSNPRTQFDVQVTGVDMSTSQYYGTNDTKVYLFVDGFTTVINIYTPNGNQGVETYLNSIPQGLQGTLLVVSTKNGGLEVDTQAITVQGDDVFTLNPQAMSLPDLEAILQNLSN